MGVNWIARKDQETQREEVAKHWYSEKGWKYARVVLVYLPDGTTPVFAAVLATFCWSRGSVSGLSGHNKYVLRWIE